MHSALEPLLRAEKNKSFILIRQTLYMLKNIQCVSCSLIYLSKVILRVKGWRWCTFICLDQWALLMYSFIFVVVVTVRFHSHAKKKRLQYSIAILTPKNISNVLKENFRKCTPG